MAVIHDDLRIADSLRSYIAFISMTSDMLQNYFALTSI